MINIIIFLVLLAAGYGFGQWAERGHYRSILKREEIYRKTLILPIKRPPTMEPPPNTALVYGSVVISVDYFKRFIAGLRLLVGGRLTSYESLLDRARREAILRMKDMAMRKGSSMVINIKLETASISKGKGDSIGSIEVYVYGTALITKSGS